MGMFDNLLSYLADAITKKMLEQKKVVDRSVNYRDGLQKRQLKVDHGQHDDNIVINFANLIVERSISMVLGYGIEFDLPVDSGAPEQLFIDALFAANKKEILLHKALLFAADGGTGYFKILPGGVIGEDNEVYNRIVVLNPANVMVDHEPGDMEVVTKYTIEYWIGDENKKTGYREVTEWMPLVSGNEEDEQTILDGIWRVTNYVNTNSKTWDETGSYKWEHDFAPIVHWQNLPDPYRVEGKPDLPQNLIDVMDDYNYTMSNKNKIIRFYAHPRVYGVNIEAKDSTTWGPDDMPIFNGSGSDRPEINQLEQLGDLAAANTHARDLRQAMFDISRTVDIDSIQDKLGSLTNFGLRVLYTDALAKANDKRLLFGEALLELVRRLLIINGFTNTAPGKIIWTDTLPKNEKEEVDLITAEVGLGIISKETAATIRGHDFEAEKEKIADERASDALNNDNIGGLLLNNFIAGRNNNAG
jgi:hypothetical protein